MNDALTEFTQMMTTRTTTQGDRQVSRLEDIEARMRSLEAEAAQLRRFGDETRFVEGDVIRFTKVWPDNPDVRYTYAAIKTCRGWYTTRERIRNDSYDKIMSYDMLIQFIIQHPTAEDVQVATHWVDVTEKINVSDGVAPSADLDPA